MHTCLKWGETSDREYLERPFQIKSVQKSFVLLRFIIESKLSGFLRHAVDERSRKAVVNLAIIITGNVSYAVTMLMINGPNNLLSAAIVCSIDDRDNSGFSAS